MDDEEVEVLDEMPEEEADDEDAAAAVAANIDDAIVISSDEGEDDESMSDGSTNVARRKTEQVKIKTEDNDDDGLDPSQFGDVANLGFLRGSEDSEDVLGVVDDPYHPASRSGRNDTVNMNSDSDDDDEDDDDDQGGNQKKAMARVARAPSDEAMQDATNGRRNAVNLNSDEDDADNGGRGVARAPRQEEEEDLTENSDGPPRKRRRRRTRLDKYSRDGRYYPGRKRGDEYDDDKKDWYDTDSDLPSKPAAAKEGGEEWRPDANAESDDEDPLN